MQTTKFVLHVVVTLATMLFVSACGTSSHVVVGQKRHPLDPAEVRIYFKAPAHYEEIAILDASSRGSVAISSQGKTDKVIEKLRREAAELGANGVLLKGIGDQYGGSVGVASATASAYGNVATAVGSGVSIPVFNKAGAGVAIYVYDPAAEDAPSAPVKAGTGPWSRLELGMARKSVRELLGEPLEVHGQAGDLAWIFPEGGSVQFKEYFVCTWSSPVTKLISSNATAERTSAEKYAGEAGAGKSGQANSPGTSFDAIPLPSWLDGSSVVAADTTFLGCVTKDAKSEDSLNNPKSTHGSAAGDASIFNVSSIYGSATGAFSPWNENTNTAPRIISRDGTQWAYLSVNRLLTPRIDPFAVVAFVRSH